MGPPPSTWPYSHPLPENDRSELSDRMCNKKCHLHRMVDNFRVFCVKFTFVLLILQVFLIVGSVSAGPVVLNINYSQGMRYFLFLIITIILSPFLLFRISTPLY